MRQSARRERNNYITFSSVLHYVKASQTFPYVETATMILTLFPIVLSAIELRSPLVSQQARLKSV